MKKQSTNNLTAASINRNFKAGVRNISAKKNPRYIYTEEDLGEGLLDACINSAYTIQSHNFKLVPWISMMRSKIS